MKKICKKILYALVLVGFILTAMNVMFALRLAVHDRDGQHGHKNCPICQQAAINNNAAILQPPPKICQVNEI